MVVQFRAVGELVFHVFGAIAQFERRLISECTKDGLETARKHGRNSGRPPLALTMQRYQNGHRIFNTLLKPRNYSGSQTWLFSGV